MVPASQHHTIIVQLPKQLPGAHKYDTHPKLPGAHKHDPDPKITGAHKHDTHPKLSRAHKYDPDPNLPGAHKYDPDPNTTRSLLRKYICPHKSSRLNIDCPTRPPPAEKMLDPPLLPMILSLLFYRNDFPPYLYGMSFGYTGISTSLPVLIFISPSSSPVPLPLLQLL